MKNITNKQLIIIGFITTLGIALLLIGFAFSDSYGQATTKKEGQSNKPKVSLIENVPTANSLTTKESSDEKKSTEQQAIEKKDTEAPILSATEATVNQGEQLNIYDGVTATDTIDGNLTNQIVASNELDTSTVGTYSIQFSATDKSGNIGTVEKLFHVISNTPEETQPAVETPVEEPAPVATPSSETSNTISATTAPMTLTMNGTIIPYQNGGQGAGQSIIDANPNGMASTWGGAAVQSGTDGQNTHFIGHNPGIFSAVFSLGIGSQIVVTDASGTPTTYTVQTLLQLDDYGNEVGTGTSYWDLAVGTGGGERITLQSCINDDINLFAIAYK